MTQCYSCENRRVIRRKFYQKDGNLQILINELKTNVCLRYIRFFVNVLDSDNEIFFR
ncbi:MAG: hypothetical protein ACJA01_004210 [Saprospiraceae bacterium]|jgi:hypothetical protein